MNMSTAQLSPIAEAIDAHLKRFEADPVINAERKSGGMALTPFYNAGAFAERGCVQVQYIIYNGYTALNATEAVAYLAWLDAGGVGTHYQAAQESAS